MNCISCGSTDFNSEYKGKIRSGRWPDLTKETFSIVSCKKCELAFLEPFPEIDYSESDYRKNYNNSDEINTYFITHDQEQTPRINKIGIEKFRRKKILEFGCGGGSFLDAVKGVSEHTVAVEPFKGYHSSLLQRQHEVFSSSEEALNKYRNKIDIIVSFGVIEHVKDPNQFLQEAYELLVEGGELILETDNKDDFLMNMDLPEFKMFYYRTAHYWYFNEKSLKNLCINSNFRNIEMNYRHGYDLSNVFHWLLDKKPTGLAKTTGISSYSNEAWRLFLEESGQAELLHVTATK